MNQGRRSPTCLVVLGALGLAAPTAAFGQPAQPAPPPPPPPTVDSLVVTAVRPEAQTAIDRTVYTVSEDLQSTSGSAGDVLRNLPSVDVDVDGNVSLRGDANVQILIDGKPSTQMSPNNRAAALQSMPADSIERIEVMTNPSAQFKPDGSAGLINIVTKKNRKPGLSGSAQASVGSGGRLNVGASGAYKKGPVNLYGGLTVRRDVRERVLDDQRSRVDPLTNLASASSQHVDSKTERVMPIVSLGIDYDPTKSDRLSGALSYSERTGKPKAQERDIVTDGAGLVTSDYDRRGAGTEREITTELSAKYRHSFAADGHELNIEVKDGETAEAQHRTYTNNYRTPLKASTSDELRPHADEWTRELSVDYALPLSAGAVFQTGYNLERNDDDYNNYGGDIDPLSGASIANPALTNHFIYGQTIHALYATYERPLGKWTALGGLRLEQVFIDTNQVTSALRGGNSYFKLYPTLHLQYPLSEAQTLRFSYSHRVSRPDPEDLNPYPVYQDAFSYRAGNSQLLPQDTGSLEAGYQYQDHGRSILATLYLRQTTNGITDVSRYITPTILVTTKENLAKSKAGGLELSARDKLGKTLSYNVSSNVYYNQIDAGTLGFAGTRSGYSYTLKGTLNYRPTDKDLLQFSANYQGKRLTAQGYRLPSATANVGYHRQLTEKVAAVLTVSDIFNSQRERSVIDTALLHDRSARQQVGRVAFLGLTWQFGGGKKDAKDDQFDYAP